MESFLEHLTKGTIIEVVSEDSKGWLKIKYEHGYGYVNGSYVQKMIPKHLKHQKLQSK